MKDIEMMQITWFYFEEEYDIEELSLMYGYGDWFIKQAIKKYRALYQFKGTEI